jgi:small GTP-binding protein
MNKLNEKYDYNAKILLIGESSVGKTGIMLRFVNDRFSNSFITTIGIDFNCKTIVSNGSKIKLQLWDTAGQERFRAITTSYYKGSNAVIIVYDVTNRDSFDRIKYWIESVYAKLSSDVIIILVGNKIDLESIREITFDEGYELAKKYDIHFFECSAKNGININKIFDDVADQFIKQFNNCITKPNKINLKKEKKKNCCN